METGRENLKSVLKCKKFNTGKINLKNVTRFEVSLFSNTKAVYKNKGGQEIVIINLNNLTYKVVEAIDVWGQPEISHFLEKFIAGLPKVDLCNNK